MLVKSYNRKNAIQYAKQWAYKRNPKYYNFDKIGGDCTNFVSQCLFSGCNVMNYTPNVGWYYNNLSDRTPSWTGVEYLYKFLVTNNGVGPFGIQTNENEITVGDIVELGSFNGFYHAMIITKIVDGLIYTSSHTIDSFDRPLTSYNYERIRYIHILGVRI